MEKYYVIQSIICTNFRRLKTRFNDQMKLPGYEKIAEHRNKIIPELYEILNEDNKFVGLFHQTDELVAMEMERLAELLASQGKELSPDDTYTAEFKIGADGSNHPWFKVSKINIFFLSFYVQIIWP